MFRTTTPGPQLGACADFTTRSTGRRESSSEPWSGKSIDVAVDLRRSSSSFGQWVGATLSAANREMLWVPPGFAHGFYVVSEEAEVLYKCTDFYSPGAERTVIWNDPDLAIDWPLTSNLPPKVSAKDAAGVRFQAAECFP